LIPEPEEKPSSAIQMKEEPNTEVSTQEDSTYFDEAHLVPKLSYESVKPAPPGSTVNERFAYLKGKGYSKTEAILEKLAEREKERKAVEKKNHELMMGLQKI
jgi:hypothetical protein